jgi:methionyl aminopeptidase
MKVNNASFDNLSFIKLKDFSWLERQRIAGKVAARALLLLEGLVKEKTIKSLLELDKLVYEFICDNKCTPTFLGYKGFPNSCCYSINQQLVHGVATNRKLENGDVISFDLGATYEGAIADTALTCIYGEPKKNEHTKIIQATEEALMKGIAAIQVGKRLGIIGNTIYKSAKGNNFSVINNYGGHGLEYDIPHAAPFVANKSQPDEGCRIMSNMTLAIEPMLTTGSTKTWIDKDGWTVWCDAEMSAHQEHTIFIHEDKVEIITDRNGLI